MKKNLLSKNIHQWLLLLVCFVATLPLWAEDYTEDGIIYDINTSTNTATVKGLEDKSATSAKIKNSVAGCEVTSIGHEAFYLCRSLTSINIPSSVTSIDRDAFSFCSSLTSINIPSSVTSIAAGAFKACSSLTSINIPSSVTSIGESAFSYCRSLTSINIPSSVTSIGKSAFSDCHSLTSINIPSSVTSIGEFVFSECHSLTSINIPSSVTSIGWSAFSGCSSLTSINIPSSVTSIDGYAFSYCSSLTSINIPNSVTRIEREVFSNCSSLTSVNIPSSVTSIERSAFRACSSLTSINIPSSVTSIAAGAFRACSSLTSINIPSSVTSIGSSAFRGCSALTAFTVDANNPNYSAEGCMLFNKEKTTLIVAVGSEKTYDIPSSVTSIDGYAFSGCRTLTSINIPSSVTSIGEAAFWNCSALTALTVDANNPNYSAEGCMLFNKEKTKLICAVGSQKTYDIPSSVTSIEEDAFQYCSSLTSINIPNSVTSIGESAFSGCSSLTSIIIPSSVTSIGESAFLNCDTLKVALIQSNCIDFHRSVFEKNTKIYAVSDNNIEIHLVDDYDSNKYLYVNDLIGGTWYTYGTPNIYASDGSTISSYEWSGNKLDYNPSQSLKAILETSTNAQILISNHKAIYNKLSEDLRNNLEGNLKKIDFLEVIIIVGDTALSDLSTNLSKAYKNVCEAVYGQLGLSDLYKLYAQAEEITSPLDKVPDYSPLLPTDTAAGNILTSADQLSTNKQETSEGPISNLVDGDKKTFFHSTWSTPNENKAYAYLQIDLKGAYDDLLLDYSKRYGIGSHGLPIQFHVFATNTPSDEESWKDCGYSNLLSYNYDDQESGKTILNLGADYQYIRLQVEKTGTMLQTNGNLFFSLSELRIYPITDYNAGYTEKDGLITDASQLSLNAIEPTQGSLAALIDNNLTTYFSSTWSQDNATGAKHYLQIDLNDAYKQIALKYSERQMDENNSSPVTLHVYATNTPEDENSWTDFGTKTCNYDYYWGSTGLLPLNFGDTAYRHIRLTVEKTTGNSQLNGNPFFSWSELHAYTRASQADKLTEATLTALTTAMQQAKAELDAGKATDATYEALETVYNTAKNEVGEGSRLVDFANSFYLTAYSDQALVVPTGVKAAVVTANGEGIRNDYRYNSGDVIPAHTGVLLKGGKGNSFYLSASESAEMAPEDNLLHGTLTDEMTNVVGANKYYNLSYDHATGTEIGFYWGAENGGAFMNKGGQAFLAIPATLQAAQLTGFSLFDLDNNQANTGIEHATATPAATLRVYDLNGRRINVNHVDELPQGIYVINGKKVIR